MKEKIELLIKEFFEKINISYDSLEVSETEKTNIFNIKIISNESNIIIWAHWKNLDSIRLILSLIISKNIWEKIKLHIEVNDYIKTKDDRLIDFIKREIDFLKKTWKDIKLPFFWAYERKKIHSFVAELNDNCIYTKSIWEGKERRLYICKNIENKLSIDIDWDDI